MSVTKGNVIEGQKWFHSPVRAYSQRLNSIRPLLPDFARRSFGLPAWGRPVSRLNPYLDTVVRLPYGKDDGDVPVGVVSKQYTLIPHTSVLEMVIKVLGEADVAPESVRADLKLTEYGERMALSVFLPAEYQYKPADGNPMALRLECINSVEGSTRFRVVMGWFRFVCENGLILGVTQADVRRRHLGAFDIDAIGRVLTEGIRLADRDKHNFERWQRSAITRDGLGAWVNTDLRKAWGYKAAARAYYIASTGYDGKVAGFYRDADPVTIPMEPVKSVPGSPRKSQTLFDVSQILAWLAKERRDLQEQVQWREQIPALMKRLSALTGARAKSRKQSVQVFSGRRPPDDAAIDGTSGNY